MIRQMRQMVRDTELCTNRRLGNKQFSDLQGVAGETTSIEVVITWIRYQMGRYRYWNDGHFGSSLIETLQGLEPVADRIAQETARTVSPTITKRQFADMKLMVWHRLVQQYVGHLRREVMACQGERR
jgi:hypothetical protein